MFHYKIMYITCQVKLCFVHYRRTYRFSKENVKRIMEMLMGDLEFQTGRGCPLSPQAQVELTLAHLGGNTFQRTAGQSHNVARTAARDTIIR